MRVKSCLSGRLFCCCLLDISPSFIYIHPSMNDQQTHSTKLLRPLQLTAIVFFTVSGGPYGLEPMLSEVGGPMTLLLLVLTPLFWSVPTVLMVLELNGMVPENGGYYRWVKRALGLKWGFLEGWWSWLWAIVDSAIYPVLFVEYASFLFRSIEPLKYAVCLVFIWVGVLLNILGIVSVGRSSVALGVSVLVPFLILFAAALIPTGSSTAPILSAQSHSIGFAGLGMGLFTVMWNFLGWDNVSPFVEEVDHPIRSYFVSILAAFALIVIVYILSVLAGIHSGMDFELLRTNGFPALGTQVAGWWLGAALSFGGMASAVGLFLSVLLYISRVPKAMADDGFLPSILIRVHPKFKTPYISILVCATMMSGMVLWGFSDLLIIDVTLYGFGLILEFISLIVLRIQEPEAERPFKIRLGLKGLVAMTSLPAFCMLAALIALLVTANLHSNAAWFALAAILTGPMAWWVVKRSRPV